MEDLLAPLDRRTLAFWRASNLIGWPVAGLGLGLGIHWVAAEYSSRYFFQAHLNIKPEWITGWSILPSFGFRLGISIVIGITVGTLIGRNVWKRPVVLATAITAAYALWIILAVAFYPGPEGTFRVGPHQLLVTGPTPVHGFGGNGSAGWALDGLTLLTVPIAALAARLAARRRP